MSNEHSSTHKSMTTKISAFAIVALLATAITNGCDGGHEGDRCNPDQTDHNECGAGLTCQLPAPCAENYCCPTPASKSSNPFCNGSGCPAAPEDAGDASIM
jgi:hypothetical protein